MIHNFFCIKAQIPIDTGNPEARKTHISPNDTQKYYIPNNGLAHVSKKFIQLPLLQNIQLCTCMWVLVLQTGQMSEKHFTGKYGKSDVILQHIHVQTDNHHHLKCIHLVAHIQYSISEALYWLNTLLAHTR
jgi:hypothetical protein